MKNIFKNIGQISIVLITLLSSCFDDKSILPEVTFPELISLQQTGTVFRITYGEVYTYEPKLAHIINKDTIPLSEAEFDEYNYVWRATLVPGADTASIVLSHERILQSAMFFAPSLNSRYYSLILDVTHKKNGVSKCFTWAFGSSGTYGPGLLVADTKNEIESDVSLIMSVSYGNGTSYNSDTIHYNIYSSVHEKPVDGLVTSMASISSPYSPPFAVITLVVPGKSVIELDPITMDETRKDFELFYYTPASYNPQHVFASSITAGTARNCVLVNDNTVQHYTAKTASKFAFVPGDSPYRFSKVCIPYSYMSCQGILFDMNSSKFMTYTDNLGVPYVDLATDKGFDPSKMEGVEPIYGGQSNGETASCLAKKDGKYYIYQFAYDFPTRLCYGQEIFDMNACTDLDKATCYEFSPGAKEFFYCVEDKLYVAILNEPNPTSKVVYNQFGAGEKITHILMNIYKGRTNWSVNSSGTPFMQGAKNRLLSVVTYNESTKEGKVYTLPIQYAGAGGIAESQYVRCYKKFGRITSIAARL